MNERDKIKFERLCEVFRRNFRVTRLYASYLQDCPKIITKEMIDTLTEDGDIKIEAAISALLSEIFNLDFDDVDDRRIIMDYITPSIRILDAKKYENDPYYKNIHLDDLTDGNWEIRWEEYAPYQAVICHDMIIEDDFKEIPPLGFFPDGFRFPAILECGNEWMTLTPVDLDTCEEAIAAAHGKVITFGLGLGYYAYMASEKEDVESVTVVELSEDVIRLFKKHILPQIPNKHKINIVNSDAFEYAEKVMPNEKFDVAFVDTWRDASDGAPMYKKMKMLEKHSPDTKFLYWVEGFLRSRLRAEKICDYIEAYEDGGLTEDYSTIEENLKKI